MAFTVSTVVDTVYGNQRIKVLNVTADGAESNLSTGLNLLSYAQVSMMSGITGCNLRENANSSGTVANGTLGMSGCVSGNVYRVVAYGS